MSYFLLITLALDVDLRSLDPRGGGDPRMGRNIGDQDMRTLPGPLPNHIPPVSEQ